MKTIIQDRSVGLKITLDPEQIFPNDPGQGTPVIVEMTKGEGKGSTGTWNCVQGEGEIDGFPITDDQRKWLNEVEPRVEKWCSEHGV